MAEPESEPGRPAGERDANGRFLPGHVGIGGRPRNFDFHALLLEGLKSKDQTVAQLFSEVLAGLRSAVANTSSAPAAAKVLLDRLCGPVVPTPVHSGEFETSDEAFL